MLTIALLFVSGIVSASPVFVPSSGNALRFNGDNTHRQYVSITPKCQVDGNPFDHENITIATWFRTTATITLEQVLVGYSFGQGPLISLEQNGGSHFRGNPEMSAFLCTNWNDPTPKPDSNDFNNPSPRLNDGQWHHMALSTSSTFFAIYIDGIAQLSCTGVMTQKARSDTFILGVYDPAFGSGNSASFTGDLDDVRIYKRAFFDEEDVFDNIMSRPPTTSELSNDILLALNFDVDGMGISDIQSQASVPVNIDIGGGLLIRSPYLVTSTAPISSPVVNGPIIIEAVQDESSAVAPIVVRDLFAITPRHGVTSTASTTADLHIWYVDNHIPNAGVVKVNNTILGPPTTFTSLTNATLVFEPVLGTIGRGLINIWISMVFDGGYRWQNALIIINSRSNTRPLAGGAGYAASFDGIDDFYIADHLAWPTKQVMLNGALTRGLSAITVEFWVWVDESSAGDTALFALGGNTEQNLDWVDQLNGLRKSGRWLITLPDETGSTVFRVGNNVYQTSTTPYYSGWTHYAFVHDGIEGPNARVYVNGQLINLFWPSYDGLQDGLLDFNHATIGTWTFWSDVYHKGIIDEFRLWNFSRSEHDIQRDMYHTLTGSELNLFSYWKFDNDDGGVVKDATGRGNNLRAGGCVPCEPRFYCQPYSLVPVTLGPDSCIPSAKTPDSSRYRSEVCYGGTVCFSGEERDSTHPTLVLSGAPIGGHTFEQFSVGGTAVDIILNGTDADGDSLVFSIETLPDRGVLQYQDLNNEWITVSSAPLALPSGVNTMRLLSSNGDGGHPFATFTYAALDYISKSIPVQVRISLICPRGKFLNEVTYRCDPCKPGSYSNDDNLDTSCTLCPENESQPNFGQTSCTKCIQGSSYTLQPGSASCLQCNSTDVVVNPDALSTSYCAIEFITDNEISRSGGKHSEISFTSLLPDGLDPADARILLSTIPQYGKLYQIGENDQLTENLFDYFFASVEFQEQYVSEVILCSHALPDRTCNQTIGEPDVLKSGSSPRAWAAFDANNGIADITLKFDTAVYMTGVVIYENTGGGAVTQIEALNPSGSFSTVWSGDPLSTGLLVMRDFQPTVCPTNFKTDTLRITVNALKCVGRNEIDAIKLLGATELKKSRNLLIENPQLKVAYVPPTTSSISGGVPLGYKYTDMISYQIQSCHGGSIVTSGVQTLKGTLGSLNVADLVGSKGVTIAAGVLASVGIITFICSGLFIYKLRKEPIVRASSIFFMNVMLVGMVSGFLVLLLTAINAADPTVIPHFCSVRPFIFSFGFVLLMGSIIVKTGRIVLIFELTKGSRIVKVTNGRLSVFVLFMILVDFIILSVMVFVDPLRDTLVVTNSTRYHICDSGFGGVLVNFSTGYKCILVLIGLALAIKGRNVPSTFNEVKALSFMAYTIATNSIIYMIISGMVSNDPNASVIIMSFTMSVALVSTWGILVAAKFYIVYFRPELNQLDTGGESSGRSTHAKTSMRLAGNSTIGHSSKPSIGAGFAGAGMSFHPETIGTGVGTSLNRQ